MYTLASINFSNRLGVVVSELPPDEMDHQDETLGAKREVALKNLESASSPGQELEEAVFGAP